MERERRRVINELTGAASGSPIAPVVSVRVGPAKREKENKYVALEKKSAWKFIERVAECSFKGMVEH